MDKYCHNKAIEFLNEQFWHDSVLYEIRIIRTDSLDQVVIPINLITNEDNWESQQTTLTFNDCYYIETKMHGGVSAMSDGEMISYATANFESSFISQTTDSLERSGMQLPKLFHFSLTLASTGSEINIVCNSVSVEVESGSRKHSAPPQIFPTR